MNIKEMLEKTASKVPQKTAIVLGSRRVSYQELDQASNRVANALIELGVNKGDHVAILMSHSPDWLINYFGIVKAGGIAVPLNSMFKAPEIDFLLRNSDSKALITEESFSQMLSSVLPTMPLLKRTIEVDSDSWENMLANSSSVPPNLELKDEAEVSIVYTSGVLSPPKGAVHTHSTFMAGALLLASTLRYVREDVILDPVPFFHVHGLLALALPCFLKGSTMVILHRLIPRVILETVERERITYMTGPTTMYLAIMKLGQEVIKKYDLSSLRGIGGGGMSLPDEISKNFRDMFGVNFLEGYGMTEVPPIIIHNPYDKPKPGTIGKPVIEVKLLNDRGEEVPSGEVGEIVVRGPNVMKGYYRLPELNSQAFREGWFYTGDLARMDEDGYYVFVEKKSLIIKTFAGNLISPLEVENVLLEHPAVAEAAIVAAPDRLRGEVPCAFVVLKQGHAATDKELRAFCQQRLAGFKVPKRVILDDHLAKTPAGKVNRARLKELISRK